MSKITKNLDQINLKVMKICTPSEYMVFSAWLTDSVNYNATQQQIADRCNFSRKHVNTQIKSLIKKDILFIADIFNLPNGKKTNIYKISNNFLMSLSKKEAKEDVKKGTQHSLLAKSKELKKLESKPMQDFTNKDWDRLAELQQ